MTSFLGGHPAIFGKFWKFSGFWGHNFAPNWPNPKPIGMGVWPGVVVKTAGWLPCVTSFGEFMTSFIWKKCRILAIFPLLSGGIISDWGGLQLNQKYIWKAWNLPFPYI